MYSTRFAVLLLISTQYSTSFYSCTVLAQIPLNPITIVPIASREKDPGIPVKDAFKRLMKTKKDLTIRIKNDTAKALHAHWGIAQQPELTNYLLYSRGWGYNSSLMSGIDTRGFGLLQCYRYYADNFIHCPSFVFDYPLSLGIFKPGKTEAQQSLDTIYLQITKCHANAKGILLGLSLGGYIALRWAAHNNPTNIAAAIVECPLINPTNIVRDFMENKAPIVKHYPSIARSMAESLANRFNLNHEILIEDIQKFPPSLPLLIVHLKDDPIVTDNAMQRLITALQKTGNPYIYFLVVEDPSHELTHGNLNSSIVFQKTTNAFLARYQLPHNAQLAQEGISFLEKAQHNAQKNAIESWDVIYDSCMKHTTP